MRTYRGIISIYWIDPVLLGDKHDELLAYTTATFDSQPVEQAAVVEAFERLVKEIHRTGVLTDNDPYPKYSDILSHGRVFISGKKNIIQMYASLFEDINTVQVYSSYKDYKDDYTNEITLDGYESTFKERFVRRLGNWKDAHGVNLLAYDKRK